MFKQQILHPFQSIDQDLLSISNLEQHLFSGIWSYGQFIIDRSYGEFIPLYK